MSRTLRRRRRRRDAPLARVPGRPPKVVNTFMDRKSIIILVISFILLVLWYPLTNRIWPPKPRPLLPTNALAGATNPLPSSTNVSAPISQEPQSNPPSTRVPTPPFISTNIGEETVVIENEDVRYTFTSHGGGLKEAELKRYPETVVCGAAKKANPNKWVTRNKRAPLPVLAILGGEAIQGDGVFRMTKTETGVRAEKTLSNGLVLTKDFQAGSNYLLTATVRFENRSSEPLRLPAQQWTAGTAAPAGPRDDPNYIGVYWYTGQKAEHVNLPWFENRFLGCFPGTPRTEYQAGASNAWWAAVHNQFFTLAVLPKEPALHVLAAKVNAPTPGPDEVSGHPEPPKTPFAIEAALIYPATTLATNQVLERQLHLYTGPREYKTLVRIGERLKNRLDLIMDYGGFFGWFAQVLLSSMNGLHALGLSYAVAIVVITIIIKLLFWPLTNASTKSMKRMAALQPQMKALQEKYKDDPVKMNRKMMEFMKEHKVSPLGGCLPMLLQIPVFFGFYKMIQSAIELRGAGFLWACDLSKPDTVWLIPGLGFPVNPLPLLMGATMLWQARLTPPSPGMDPMQQKIMKYMPLMFLFILYNFSAGLTLYWTVQNLLTIAQMKVTRAKEEPAAGAPKGPAAKTPSPKMLPKKKKP